MLIADAQVHVWAADTAARPWPQQDGDLPKPHWPEPLTAGLLLERMSQAGVDRAVLVSPSFEGTRNDVVCEAARLHPARFAVMARFDLASPQAPALVQSCRALPGVRGIRMAFHRPSTRALLEGGRLDWFWAQAEAQDLPLMLLAQHADLPRLAQVAARHPRLRIALDHLGLTEGKDEEAFRHFDQVLALASYPNVSAKASCLPLFTADAYPFKRLQPWIRQAYDAFGPRRLFWGSDLSRLPCTYSECVRLFTEELDWLSAEDRAWIMGRGLCAWLGWPD